MTNSHTHTHTHTHTFFFSPSHYALSQNIDCSSGALQQDLIVDALAEDAFPARLACLSSLLWPLCYPRNERPRAAACLSRFLLTQTLKLGFWRQCFLWEVISGEPWGGNERAQNRGKPCMYWCYRNQYCCCVSYSVVSDSLLTPWTAARQAPLSVGFSRQEYWSGLPFPSPGDLPDPGIKPSSPTLQADSLSSEL